MEAHAEGLEGRPHRAEVLTSGSAGLVVVSTPYLSPIFHRPKETTLLRVSSGAMKEGRLHHLEAALSFSDSGFTVTPVGTIRAPRSDNPKNLDRLRATR